MFRVLERLAFSALFLGELEGAEHRLALLSAASEEGLEVLAHHAMQRRLLRVVRRRILSSGARAGASSVGARGHAERPCKPWYDPPASELQGKHPSAAGVAAAWRRCTPGERAPSFELVPERVAHAHHLAVLDHRSSFSGDRLGRTRR